MSNHVREAITARLVLLAAGAIFSREPDKERVFRTNPANTLPYSALAALEHEAVVQIAEILHDEHELHPTSAKIRRKAELALHRNALSHPLTVEWRTTSGQEFFDQQRVWKDFRPGLVWDMQKSVNEELRARGQPTHNEDIPITMGMVLMLQIILELSIIEGKAPPDRASLFAWLTRAKEKYVQLLDLRPEG